MKATIHAAHGVVVRVYCLDKDEKIHRHTDPFNHTTSVAAGRTQVWIDHSGESFDMEPHDPPETLPAFVEHEIIALEDGTVVVNICPS